MPWFTRKKGSQTCVVKGTKDNPGKELKCYSSREDAVKYMRSLYMVESGREFTKSDAELEELMASDDPFTEVVADGGVIDADTKLHVGDGSPELYVSNTSGTGDPLVTATAVSTTIRELNADGSYTGNTTVISHATIPSPPSSFFTDPQLTSLQRYITVTSDGRVYTHLASWDECFAGETEYITRGGVRTLKETVGTIQQVLTSACGNGLRLRSGREFGGKWVDAEIRSFGVQELMKVTLRRFGQQKEVYATPGHRWFVTPKRSGNYKYGPREVVVTSDLAPGMRLSPLFAKKGVTAGQRGRSVRPSSFGIAHGFTFGDGCRDGDGCRVDLYGKKDEVLLSYFSMSQTWEGTDVSGNPYKRVRNLPAFFKDLPPMGESRSYLYGWLAGYFAADGTVSSDGTPILFSATKEHLSVVRDICIRLGISTTDIKTFMRKGADGLMAGKVKNDRVRPLHRLTFIAKTLTEDFFLNEEHRRRFLARPEKTDGYTAWTVASVERTDREEEVFCAVVPEYENFALADNINVMNCHVGHPNACISAPRESDYSNFTVGTVVTSDGKTIPTGVIALKGGHASIDADAVTARSHYDNPDSAIADVVVGTDEFGIWVSGALRPTATEEDIHAFRASGVSGDWRQIDGELRLIGICSVNVPGFPKLSMAASADTIDVLIAAGGPPIPDPTLDCSCHEADILAKLGDIETILVASGIMDTAFDKLSERISQDADFDALSASIPPSEEEFDALASRLPS